MTTLFGPILAAALFAQIPGATLDGKVVDDQGKPVAGAQVVCFAFEGKPGPRQEVQTETDATGQFGIRFPWPRVAMTRAIVWAYRPGLAVAATRVFELVHGLKLRKPEPRSVKVEGPDGQPLAGAIVSPRFLLVGSGNVGGAVTTPLVTSLVVTTDREGKAALDYLAAGDRLAVARVTAEPIGSQDLQLIADSASSQSTTITIRLKPTSHLAGRVRNRAGQPAAGQVVEVWHKLDHFPPNRVDFKDGPLRTAADGSFRTPDNLLVGSSYRVVVRAAAMEPILSHWITIEPQPRVLLPMIQRPLRTISGRVVDRQGKPLAHVEVFQLSEGPEPTATKTDGDGRFALGGFRHGPVFLFARGDGFRFFGRLLKLGDGDITVELTRTSERPAKEMRMLPEPIPLDESRALGRRLIEPYWEAAVAAKDSRAAGRALLTLVAADPVGVLQKLEANDFVGGMTKALIERYAARALARTDPARAQEVAEAIGSPRDRSAALVAVADRLLPAERDRKLALALVAQSLHARGLRRSSYSGGPRLGRGWLDLGEKEKAKALFAELTSHWPKERSRGVAGLSPALARVDLATGSSGDREGGCTLTIADSPAGSTGILPSTWPLTTPPKRSA